MVHSFLWPRNTFEIHSFFYSFRFVTDFHNSCWVHLARHASYSPNNTTAAHTPRLPSETYSTLSYYHRRSSHVQAWCRPHSSFRPWSFLFSWSMNPHALLDPLWQDETSSSSCCFLSRIEPRALFCLLPWKYSLIFLIETILKHCLLQFCSYPRHLSITHYRRSNLSFALGKIFLHSLLPLTTSSAIFQRDSSSLHL